MEASLLEEKGHVTHTTEGRAHRYEPLVERAASYLPESITEHLDFEPGDVPEAGAEEGSAEKDEESVAAEPDAEKA